VTTTSVVAGRAGGYAVAVASHQVCACALAAVLTTDGGTCWPPDGGGVARRACFPAVAVVTTGGGAAVRMDALALGDELRVAAVAGGRAGASARRSTLWGWSHRDAGAVIAQCALAVMIDEIPLRCLVSCDETHTAGGDMLRRYGRSRRNVPCVLRDRDTRPVKRTSTMVGVSLSHGVLWSQMVIVGNAQTADDWLLFLQCLRTHMNTYVPGLA